MRVNLLSYEPAGGWILYDYAVKLAEALRPHVDSAEVGFAQKPGFDVTFHVNYAGLRALQVPGLHCSMVTHIDTAEKFNLVRAQAMAGVWGMCMSEETARRLATLSGLPLFGAFAPPAMLAAPHHRLTVMIAGRIYPDGRKNEAWALDFLRAFRPQDIALRIMGSGWEPQVAELRARGVEVQHSSDFERGLYVQWLRESDHLLVTGFDEGALSTLDAILHGAVPIVTAQGYHLEQEGEVIGFSSREQLMAIAERLQRGVDEVNAMRRRMTDWDGFARRHVAFWRERLAQAASAAPAAAEPVAA